jgi:uncharacterized protein (TIGR02996 family)
MTERQALFEAILANPDDDLPRLVFADWLEEHGETDRSEFIRVQIERARLDEYDPLRGVLQERERELAKCLVEEESPFRELLARQLLPDHGRGWDFNPWEYERGFIECVEFWSPDEFLGEAEALFRLAPIRHLYVHGEDGWSELFQSPHFAHLHTLEINRANVSDAELMLLASSTHAHHLKCLAVEGAGISDVGFGALTRSFALSGLECLSLQKDPHGGGTNFIGPTGIHHLINAPYFTRLTRLDFSGNILGPMGASFLASWVRGNQLTHLRLSNCGLRGDAWTPLLSSPHLNRLKQLDLSNNGLDAAFAQTLATWPNLSTLRHLDLDGNPLLSFGIIPLIESPALASLQLLSLAETGIGDAGVRAILASPHLNGIRHLDLRGNGMILAQEREALKRRFGDRALV